MSPRIVLPLLLLLSGLAAPPRASAQERPDLAAGRITLIDSEDAVCAAAEARSARRPRGAMCIVGLAQHPSGISRVLMNGGATVTDPQPAGAVRFVGFVPAAALARDIEIVAHSAEGTAVRHLYALVTEPGVGGYLMRKEASVVAEATPPPPAQRAEQTTIVIQEPREWMGEGTRSIRVPAGQSLRVVGRAHHPSGIARVTVNDHEAVLQPHPSGAMHFIVLVAAEEAEAGVRVVAHPVRGEAYAKAFGTGPGAVATPAVAAAPPRPGAADARPAPAAPAAPEAAVAAPAPVAAADEAAAPRDPRHYIEVLEPTEWTGSGTRGMAAPMRQSVRVVGEARHQAGVRTVLINNARASLQPQPDGTVRFIGYVPVTSGTQGVEIRVEGQNGPPLRRQFAIEPQPALQPVAQLGGVGPGRGFRGQRWAVVVGISRYADPGITPLRFADRDAQAFYDFLVSDQAGAGGFDPANVRLLLNEEATFLALRNALFTFLKSSTEDDQVILYFAGHGAPDPQRRDDLFLLAHDTRADDISGTGFPMYEMQNAVQRILARDILVITDACHGGGVAQPFAMRNLETNLINEIFLNQLNASTGGIVTFTGSMANQTSAEDERWGGGHGVFTYYMLEALRGAADEDGDGIVTLLEMMEWTKDRVRRETQNAQIPSISSTAYDQLWPVAIVRQGDAAPAVAQRAARPAERPTPATRATTQPAAAQAARQSQADALARAREAVQMYPNSALYWNALGQVLLEAGETGEAITSVQEAARLEPTNAEYRFRLGTLLRDSGKPDAAALALREAVRIAPRNAQYLNALGSALLQAGQTAAAVEEFRRATRIEQTRGQYQRDLGFALLELGRARDAEQAYAEALRLEPSVAQYHFEYARLLQSLGRELDLIASLQSAARLDSLNVAYRSELGAALQRNGRMHEAAEAYRGAARLDPTDAQLQHALGVLLRLINRQFETIEAFREAVRLAPENALYRFDLGVALRGSARPEDALPEFREALRIEPDNAAYRNGYGVALHRLQKAREALDELRQAVRIAPTNAEYRYDVAVVLREVGLLDEAIAELEEALRIQRGNSTYREELNAVRRLRTAQQRGRN
jgi:tetratricopeptide (TPR) repeat protein